MKNLAASVEELEKKSVAHLWAVFERLGGKLHEALSALLIVFYS